MKECSICQIEKTSDNFAGRDKRCKECKAAAYNVYYQRNKEEVKLRSIKKKYGLSKEAYYELLALGCEVCGHSDKLVVDHDHRCCPGNFTCGKCIRGALCRRCNIAEGLFNNDPENMANLLKYMEKYGIINKN